MTGKARRSLLCWLGLSPLLVVVLFPYATMLSTALKRKDEIFQFEVIHGHEATVP